MHLECNLNLILSKKISYVFHHLQSYDLHLIFKDVVKYNFKVKVIPKAIEKYKFYNLNMSFTIQQSKEKAIKPRLLLVFIDSVRFLVINLGEKNFYRLSSKSKI